MMASPPLISPKTGQQIYPRRMPYSFSAFRVSPPSKCTDRCEIQSVVANSIVSNLAGVPSSAALMVQLSQFLKVPEIGDAKCGLPTPKCDKTPSQLESEEMRQIFIDKKLKEAKPHVWRQKCEAGAHLKRIDRRYSNRESSMQQNQSKLTRSATFTFPTSPPDQQGNCGSEKKETKISTIAKQTTPMNRWQPSKIVDTNSRSLSKIEARTRNEPAKVDGQRKGQVKMNRAALLRVALVRKGGAGK